MHCNAGIGNCVWNSKLCDENSKWHSEYKILSHILQKQKKTEEHDWSFHSYQEVRPCQLIYEVYWRGLVDGNRKSDENELVSKFRAAGNMTAFDVEFTSWYYNKPFYWTWNHIGHQHISYIITLLYQRSILKKFNKNI